MNTEEQRRAQRLGDIQLHTAVRTRHTYKANSNLQITKERMRDQQKRGGYQKKKESFKYLKNMFKDSRQQQKCLLTSFKHSHLIHKDALTLLIFCLLKQQQKDSVGLNDRRFSFASILLTTALCCELMLKLKIDINTLTGFCVCTT